MIDTIVYAIRATNAPLSPLISEDVKELITVSIHQSLHEANTKADTMRCKVFQRLGTEPSPLVHFVQRMLAYRDSIVVVPCTLVEKVKAKKKPLIIGDVDRIVAQVDPFLQTR